MLGKNNTAGMPTSFHGTLSAFFLLVLGTDPRFLRMGNSVPGVPVLAREVLVRRLFPCSSKRAGQTASVCPGVPSPSPDLNFK